MIVRIELALQKIDTNKETKFFRDNFDQYEFVIFIFSFFKTKSRYKNEISKITGKLK